MLTLKVVGGASGRTLLELSISPQDQASMGADLMGFLRSHKIPVASACFGEGICLKCTVQAQVGLDPIKNVVSCQESLTSLTQEKRQNSVMIFVSYL